MLSAVRNKIPNQISILSDKMLDEDFLPATEFLESIVARNGSQTKSVEEITIEFRRKKSKASGDEDGPVTNSHAEKPPPMRASYDYVTLSSLPKDRPKSKVDIYGVIVGFSPIKMTKSGTQKYFMSFYIIDESMHNPSAAVVLNYFSDDPNKIPVPQFAGDIIRCHRVKSIPYRNEIQLTGQDPMTSLLIISRKRESHNGLPVILTRDDLQKRDLGFSAPNEIHDREGDVHGMLSPHVWSVMSVKNSNTFTDDDSNRVNNLLRWSENVLMKNFLGNVNSQYCTIYELHKQSRLCQKDTLNITDRPMHSFQQKALSPVTCDLIAMVIDVVHNSEFSFIFVWDGTTSGHVDASSIDYAGFDPVPVKRSLHAAGEYANILDSASFYNPASRSIIRNSWDKREINHFRLFGEGKKILHIADGNSINVDLRNVKSGSWVKFRDLSCIPPSQDVFSDVIGTLTQSTSIIPLHQFHKDVTNVVKRYLNHHQREITRIRSSTVYRPNELQHDLLAICVSAESPRRFNIKARVVDWYPSEVCDFVCSSPSSSSKEFVFSLRVIDAVMTAIIDVIFTSTHGDAEYLLGISANEFASNPLVRQQIHDRLNTLKVHFSASIYIDIYLF